jgi:hypothetical protein
LLRRRAVLAGLLAAASPVGLLPARAAAPGTAPAPIRDKGYVLVKNWDFGVTIRSEEELRREFYTRYVYEGGRLDHLKDEWQRYADNGNHVIEGDVLKLVARIAGGLRDGGIESGMLRSKWTGKHGYYECRMKAPPGRGMWPAFWLNPEDQTWPPEIDVVEIVNNGRDTTRNSFHNLHPGTGRTAPILFSKLDRWGSYHPDFDYTEAFHTFAVEWTADLVRHFIDEVLVAERRFEWKHDDGRDAGPAHVLVNLAVGGKWPGPPTDAAEFPAALDVDYIRVWQR